MKTCKRCGETRPLAEFHKQKAARDRHSSWCKECHKQHCRDRYRANPTRAREYGLRARYGLTNDDYQRMLEQQGGACAICHRPDTTGRGLFVDHCHDTGRVRALLCHGCNTMIGLAQENPDRLRAGARYIELHQSTQLRNID